MRRSTTTKTPRKPPGNRRSRDYSRSGIFALQRGLQGVGLAWLADTGELAKPLQAWRAEMREALGGDSISPQREAILDAVTMDVLLLSSVDAYIASMPSPVNKSKRSLFPIVAERARLADALTKRLATLGLDRVEKSALDVRAYLEANYGEAEQV